MPLPHIPPSFSVSSSSLTTMITLLTHTSEAASFGSNDGGHHAPTAVREFIIVGFSAGRCMREHDVITITINWSTTT